MNSQKYLKPDPFSYPVVWSSPPAPNKGAAGAILEELKGSPFRKGDLQEQDTHGRDNEIMIAGDWLVTFWVDHAVREIRVVRLESAED